MLFGLGKVYRRYVLWSLKVGEVKSDWSYQVPLKSVHRIYVASSNMSLSGALRRSE